MQLTKRKSNIELIRILSIVLIVVSHYCRHNGVDITALPFSFNKIILQFLQLGNIGSILFVLISGYFLIDSEKVKLSKILKLIFQVWFYSVLFYTIFFFAKYDSFNYSLTKFIKYIFPLSFKIYWFATVYFVLFIIHPFINKLLNNLDKKEYIIFIILQLLLVSICNMALDTSLYCNEIIEFIFFYSIGAFIKKYNNSKIFNIKYNLISSTICLVIMLMSLIVFNLIGEKISFFMNHSLFLFSRTSPIAILFAASIFNIFNKIDIKSNKIINKISSLVFGIYLISDHPMVRKFLWIDIFENYKYVESHYLIIHLVVTVIIVFAISLFIEFIRKATIEKVTDKLIKIFESKLSKIKNGRIYNKIMEKYIQ